jgi:predicted HicB family RNase H-like nuclease
MPPTEAQLRANKKYLAKFDNIQIRVPQGEKEVISDHAKSQGESLNGFVRRAIQEAMERDVSRKTASSGCEESDKSDA